MRNASDVNGPAGPARRPNRTENFHTATNDLPARFGLTVLIWTAKTVKQSSDQFVSMHMLSFGLHGLQLPCRTGRQKKGV